MTVLQNNYQNGRNVDDYWSLSTLESGREVDECESCLSHTRHETYTSVTLGAVGIIIVLVVSFVFFLHFSSNPSQPGIKDFSPLGVALLGVLLRTMSAPAQYVQNNGSKLGTHTFVGCYTGCVPLFKTLSVPAEYVRDKGTQAQSLADTFAG